jgi:lipopolysaccharide/colanic/teichoic acid biosynthesis glycosyltransferase
MYAKYIKRAFDLVLAIVITIVTSPLWLAITFILRFFDNGPILFTQMRTGKDGTNFKMYKFRTMVHNNDPYDKNTANKLTKIGKLVRAFSLDELPQILNVIKGQMSFIGPRPWMTDYYKHMNAIQRERVKVRPGITGLAQVMGRNSLTIYEKINYDLGYVKRIGLREDLKIIFLTIVTVFQRGSNEIDKQSIHQEIETLQQQDRLMES